MVPSFVGDVIVGNLQVVERDPEPAFVLRVGPRVDERDPRSRHSCIGGRGTSGYGDHPDPSLPPRRDGRADRPDCPRPDHPGPALKSPALRLEPSCGDILTFLKWNRNVASVLSAL